MARFGLLVFRQNHQNKRGLDSQNQYYNYIHKLQMLKAEVKLEVKNLAFSTKLINYFHKGDKLILTCIYYKYPSRMSL